MSEEKKKDDFETKAEKAGKNVGDALNKGWEKTKEIGKGLTKGEQAEKKEKVQIGPEKTDEVVIYCTKCGSKNKSNANYCSKCGAKIVASQDEKEDSARKMGESIGGAAKKGWDAASAVGKGFMNGIKGKEDNGEKEKKQENSN